MDSFKMNIATISCTFIFYSLILHSRPILGKQTKYIKVLTDFDILLYTVHIIFEARLV